MINQLIQREDKTIINVYKSNNTAQKHMKQKLTELKEETGNSTTELEPSIFTFNNWQN